MVFAPWLYALLGLVIGSFLNVCIYRIPRGESIVLPSSHCPACGASIRPFDNVPLLSYLWLRGRCRSCKASISLQYPVVELLNGAAFYFCALRWGAEPPLFLNSAFLAVLIILVFVDYQHQILPNVLTLPGTAAGILLSPFQSRSLFLDRINLSLASALRPEDPEPAVNWAGAILGALVGGGILYLVALLYKLVRKQQGLGMGDIKMMAMVGAFLGWRLALLTIFAGSFLGSVVGVFLILFHGRNLQTRLAFGTFLGVGAALSLFFGPSFLRWYTAIR
jgi:leader peptidase (prepilin peptidase)/N-methyltransferase